MAYPRKVSCLLVKKMKNCEKFMTTTNKETQKAQLGLWLSYGCESSFVYFVSE